MQIKKVLITGFKIVAVCLLFVFCMAVGLTLSGITRLAPQAPRPPSLSLFPF
ncbi:MAG: hypothetical protein WBL63_23880 [Candidatus Acidiferrum sp.]